MAEVLYRIDWSATSLLSSPCLVAEYLLAGARSKRINRHKQVHKALCHAREAVMLINPTIANLVFIVSGHVHMQNSTRLSKFLQKCASACAELWLYRLCRGFVAKAAAQSARSCPRALQPGTWPLN